jgi:hypothetical protein
MKYKFESDEELKLFIRENIITTMETAALLKCSRQNVDKMVNGDKLIPVKQTQRDKLFLKSDVVARMKPS